MRQHIVLRAFLAAAFAAFLAEMKPHLSGGVSFTTGFKHFDLLTREQQIVAVHEVCQSLLQDNAAPLEHAAYRHATLLAVFACAEKNVCQEILEGSTTFRTLILAAHRDLYGIIDHGITTDCTEVNQWNAFVKSIRRKFAEEKCLEISNEVLDLPPEWTASQLQKLGVDSDFFLIMPDDPVFFRTSVLSKKVYDLCAKCLNEYMQYFLLPNLLNGLHNADLFSTNKLRETRTC